MLQSFNRTTVKTYAVGEPTIRLGAAGKLTAFLHMLHTIEEKRAWTASRFNTSLFQMVAQRNSLFLLDRRPWHQLQTPALAFPVPSLPHLLLPPGSHSLLSTHALLGHYSEGEHSSFLGTFWGENEEPQNRNNFVFLTDLHETGQRVLQKNPPDYTDSRSFPDHSSLCFCVYRIPNMTLFPQPRKEDKTSCTCLPMVPFITTRNIVRKLKEIKKRRGSK